MQIYSTIFQLTYNPFLLKDLLVTEMYQLISKEAEIAKYIAQIISIRKSYHESALNLLTSMEGELATDLSTILK